MQREEREAVLKIGRLRKKEGNILRYSLQLGCVILFLLSSPYHFLKELNIDFILLHHSDRLSNQLRSQQQVIEQQHSDYEVLACSEGRARKELAAVTHDLEVANKNLKKYFEAEYDHQVMVSVLSPYWVLNC